MPLAIPTEEAAALGWYIHIMRSYRCCCVRRQKRLRCDRLARLRRLETQDAIAKHVVAGPSSSNDHYSSSLALLHGGWDGGMRGSQANVYTID